MCVPYCVLKALFWKRNSTILTCKNNLFMKRFENILLPNVQTITQSHNSLDKCSWNLAKCWDWWIFIHFEINILLGRIFYLWQIHLGMKTCLSDLISIKQKQRFINNFYSGQKHCFCRNKNLTEKNFLTFDLWQTYLGMKTSLSDHISIK